MSDQGLRILKPSRTAWHVNRVLMVLATAFYAYMAGRGEKIFLWLAIFYTLFALLFIPETYPEQKRTQVSFEEQQ